MKQFETILRERMARRGLKKYDIDFFLSAWRGMSEETTPLDWQQVTPFSPSMACRTPDPGSSDFERLHAIGLEHLSRCAIVKLNGGRSTTMGGQVPKCMVEAKDGHSFLDILMGQLLATNNRNGIEMPLVLMNSFFTDHVTEKIVGKTPLVIMNFIQNEYPRIRVTNLMPLDTGCDDDWCPAGHGDFYSSLASSGLLDGLLDLGIDYVFISNVDNLAAEISVEILGQMVNEKHDFMMEVTRKTTADIKGGAPILYDGQPSLLEIAQVPAAHIENFQNIDSFSYFNTNNIWVDLRALKKLLTESRLSLPIIRNRKIIRDIEVIQIETAMGAGLQCFNKPAIIEVPRSRFAPVKTEADLTRLRSDAYILDGDYHIHATEKSCSSTNDVVYN